MKYFTGGITFLFLLLLAAACKKERDCSTSPLTAFLSVKLNNPYLLPGQVDSAFATWKANNQEQRIRLNLSHDSLLADMGFFQEGNGELTIHIYSNKKYSNQYFGQWICKKNVSLQKKKAINYNGPSSFFDAAWFPRVKLKDAIGHEAVIALRPDDAYFTVKDPGHPLLQLTVDRGYWKTVGGIQLAGRDVWQCTDNCTDKEDDIFFKSLPQRIGAKPWNHISITILFETDINGGGWILSLEHEP